jgi:hypothetical protein
MNKTEQIQRAIEAFYNANRKSWKRSEVAMSLADAPRRARSLARNVLFRRKFGDELSKELKTVFGYTGKD